MTVVRNFPHLTDDEFVKGCQELLQLFINAELTTKSDANQTCLRIRKELFQSPTQSTHSFVQDEGAEAVVVNGACLPPEAREADEDDDDAELKTLPNRKHEANYQIVLSPTYRVPVLYFQVKDPTQCVTLGLDEAKEALVPESQKAQLENVGVMGAISYGELPSTGAPALFVHPCNTGQAMSEVTGGRAVNVGEYMLLWLGIVGHAVSLAVPVAATP